MAQLAWYITLLLVLAILAVFYRVASKSGEAADYEAVQASAYSFRAKLFWGLIVLGVIVAWGTLRGLPYVRSEAAVTPQIVKATGYQWYWEIDPGSVVAGQPVEFRVDAGDVNHGFGIYDAQNRLIAQTQAMPGYTNLLRHTFEKPGTYQIMCLEFCGVAHHAMIQEFEVKAP